MKPITVLSAALLLIAQSSNAQFLNKLKRKAQAAVTNAVLGNGSTNSGAGSNSADNTSMGTTQGNGFNAAQYGQVACTLQAGEFIIYGEHSLNIVNNQTHVKVITSQNRQYYLYEDGKRNGPFATAPVNQLDNWNRDPYHAETNNKSKSTDWQPYVSRGVLTVDGKSYGAVTTITAFYHNKAQKKFYCVAVRLEQSKMATYLITEKGATRLPAPVNNLLISDHDDLGAVMINATQYNAKSDEDLYKYVLNDDFYVVFTNGTKIGPLKAVQAENSYLDNNGRFIQIAKARKAVFMNGEQVFTFPNDSYGDGKFYPAKNGKGGAWFERGSMFFSDGTSIIDYVMQPALSTENDKQVINWLTLQNHKLYVCKKEL